MKVDKIVPHCPICREEMKMGQEVVMDSLFKGILHADCINLPFDQIEDQGKFEEVISRNQEWLNVFNSCIVH